MSTLRLNELIIVQGDTYVYHEKFDSKTNIISGDNSTGKSSISSFIFFALGGDFTEWLPEAKSCDYVLAELLINDVYVTIRRNLDKNEKKDVMSKRPMYINIAKLEDAIKSYTAGWKIYPYSKTDKQETFSQIIFDLLNFPEVSTDNLETVTLNQILRLLYVDQLSSLNALMRNEDFDSPLVRDAIGNLLLGTYSDDKLKFEKELRETKKESSSIKSQVKALEDVFEHSSFDFDSSKIVKNIEALENQLGKINESLQNPQELIDKTKPNDTKKELDVLRVNLKKYKNDYQNIKSKIEYLEADYLDSNEFIKVIEDKLKDINKSIRTRQSFGKLTLEYCPSCLEKIVETDDKHCGLCKLKLNDAVNLSRFTRMKLELEMQLKESKNLIKQRDSEIISLKEELRTIQSGLRNSQREFDLFTNKTRSSSNNLIDKLIQKKSNLTYEIIYQEKQLELVSSYEEYRIRQAQLQARIEILTSEIEKFSTLQRRNASKAYSKISEYALELIKADGKYEEKFIDGRKVTTNFRENTFYLDGRNRFSASSMVILKNSVRFAIFFASIELDFFRYPKFILCDNVEDKGMVDKRSKNFQKKVVEIAELDKFKDKDFQIIFTTSKISKKLNIPKYTVGKYSTKKSKTLDFNGVK
ncbi:AAA family ATPase [Olleya sp. Hel_I_94]|uniref:AAA family ATPase n=1 Tax=Olleya sp. Hel_I_94 TaxID=1250001 RepID=UPI0011A06529|nr:AAA family ATPase [Olleya sp. Hel_I_94]TVZ48648.1 AAA domain-containing protein [Olleya sp. Hel_I_94]